MQRGPASSSQCQHYQSTRPGRTNRHPGIQSQNTHTHKKKRENSLDTQTERSKPHTQIKLKTKRVEGRNGNNGEYASVIAQDNESKRTRASEGKQEVKSNSKQPKFQPSLTTSKHRQPATTQRATAEVKKKKNERKRTPPKKPAEKCYLRLERPGAIGGGFFFGRRPFGALPACLVAGPSSILRMPSPNASVQCVSCRFDCSGLTLMNTQVLESPPSESCSTCVSFELR